MEQEQRPAEEGGGEEDHVEVSESDETELWEQEKPMSIFTTAGKIFKAAIGKEQGQDDQVLLQSSPTWRVCVIVCRVVCLKRFPFVSVYVSTL